MIENTCISMENNTRIVRIPCAKCKKNYEIRMSLNLLDEIENFPFPVLCMHVKEKNVDDDQAIHTLIAYLDGDLRCRQVEILVGSQIFITPYILYNPSLLNVYCLNGTQKKKEKPINLNLDPLLNMKTEGETIG